MTDRWRAARALLDQAETMGLELADLVAVGEAPAAPTVAVYVAAVATTFTPGTGVGCGVGCRSSGRSSAR
jgi:hypothetical protein